MKHQTESQNLLILKINQNNLEQIVEEEKTPLPRLQQIKESS